MTSISKAAALLGRRGGLKGGKASGACKVRGDSEHYARIRNARKRLGHDKSYSKAPAEDDSPTCPDCGCSMDSHGAQAGTGKAECELHGICSWYAQARA